MTIHKQVPSRVIIACDRCSDLCSDASPNQYTDPKSAWARRRAVKNMKPAQLRKFALEACYIYEWVGHIVYLDDGVSIKAVKTN
jgi:hypothetical protein